MKIFGICLIKNEEDIIKEVLEKASKWCDYIFVYDNGSSDNTWLIVNSLAKLYPQIIPFKSDNKPFGDHLRLEVFNNYRNLSMEGDWWCRLDADEIYIDNPKQILKKVSRFYDVVYNESYQFYFTNVDVDEWKKNPVKYENCKDYETVLSYYLCNWSEIRFFRYRNRLKWDYGSWPKHLGVASPLRIRLKHYQYRNPKQIQKRLIDRQNAALQGHSNFLEYSSESDWKDKIVHDSKLNHTSEGWILNPKIFPYHKEDFIKKSIKILLHTIKFFP